MGSALRSLAEGGPSSLIYKPPVGSQSEWTTLWWSPRAARSSLPSAPSASVWVGSGGVSSPRRTETMQQEDQNWPRRKKSDLMVGRVPDYQLPGYRRVKRVDPVEPSEVVIPIKRSPAKITPVKPEDMWPKRRKSDLLIYQQTRNV